MKKRIALLLSCAMLVGTFMSVYAACDTHVTDQVSRFIRVTNAKDNGTHSYPKLVSSVTGEVLEWGTCRDVLFTEEWGWKCTNCGATVKVTGTPTRLQHNRQ